MKSIYWFCSILFCLPSCVLAADAGPLEYFPIEDLRPGMKGYGLSCFQGQEPIHLEVEISGVIRNNQPERSMILCRVSGGPVDRGGIMAGMSGSPVYIDDKLVGAMAYAFGFAREPVCGITPIQSMDRLWKSPPPSKRLTFYKPESSASKRLDLFKKPLATLQNNLYPISIPIIYSGIPDQALDEIFGGANSGFTPMTGGSSPGRASTPLIPGGAIGVSFIDGDVRMAGMGTITDVREDRLIAFGHPMFHGGACNFPMISGEASDFIPSLAVSNKVFNTGDLCGVVDYDSNSGVGGTIGPPPAMIPVQIRILSADGKLYKHRIAVVDDEDLLVLFTSFGISSLISYYDASSGDRSYVMDVIVTFDGIEPLHLSRISARAGSVFEETFRAIECLNDILNNPISPVSLQSIDFQVRVSEIVDQITLQSIELSRYRYMPGETIQVKLNLKSHRDEPSSRTIEIQLPKALPSGDYMLGLWDSSRRRSWLTSQRVEPGKIQKVAQLIDRYRDESRDDSLYLVIYESAKDMTFDDVLLPDIPPSIIAIGSLIPEEVFVRDSQKIQTSAIVPFPCQIIGVKEMPVQIRAQL